MTQQQEYDCISILQDDVFAYILDQETEVEKLNAKESYELIAKRLGVEKAFKARLKAFEKDNERLNAGLRHYEFDLERNKDGKVLNTTNNYLTILRSDKRFRGKLKLNELSDNPEKLVNGKPKEWTEVDDSKTKCYIEKEYSIYSEKKLYDALNIVFKENTYNPVKDIIESVEWDGVSRIYTILNKWLKVFDDAYSREVSRLIFAGGIHRLYDAGCKFDDMPVLIGTRQGEGKSTFVNWLAIQDDFFREVKEIEGQKGIEVLQGAWICEMGELLALTKTKEVEAVKAYITCRVDAYRKPYERRTTRNPRKCIFIGTTNKEQFLTDKTGNRRFYPVTVNCTGYELYEHEEEIRHDILQAWAEALRLYRENKLEQCANKELLDVIREHQENAVEEDYRKEIIRGYLEDKQETCIFDIWFNALDEKQNPRPKDSAEIGLILRQLNWENTSKNYRVAINGKSNTHKRWVNANLPF